VPAHWVSAQRRKNTKRARTVDEVTGVQNGGRGSRKKIKLLKCRSVRIGIGEEWGEITEDGGENQDRHSKEDNQERSAFGRGTL